MRKFSLFILFFLFFPSLAFAKIFHVNDYHRYGPVATRSQNPLYLLFLYDPIEKPETLSKKDWAFSVETSFSNIFEHHLPATGVGVDLDMELVRTAFKASYGITPGNTVGIEIPFLSFSGGFLDSFIQNFHHFFGLPNGGRDKVPNGRFSYAVTNKGVDLYRVNQQTFGLSDIIIWNKAKIAPETKTIPAISIKASLKLPTGRSGSGTGSDRPDIGVSILAEKNYKKLHSYTQLGFLGLDGFGPLSPIIRNAAVVFGEALEFNLFEHVSLLTQVTGNTPIFKGVSIDELSWPVFDLTVGFTGDVPLKKVFKQIHYEAGFTEDVLSKGPSVDFAVFFKLGMVY